MYTLGGGEKEGSLALLRTLPKKGGEENKRGGAGKISYVMLEACWSKEAMGKEGTRRFWLGGLKWE